MTEVKDQDNNKYSNVQYKGEKYNVDVKVPLTNSAIVSGVVGFGLGIASGIYLAVKYICTNK